MATRQREARAFEAGAIWAIGMLPEAYWPKNNDPLPAIRAEARRRYGKKVRKP